MILPTSGATYLHTRAGTAQWTFGGILRWSFTFVTSLWCAIFSGVQYFALILVLLILALLGHALHELDDLIVFRSISEMS